MYELVGPHDWNVSSVFDLAHWKNGLAFKNIDFSDHGRPVIKIAELKNGVSPQTARTMADYDRSVFVKAGDMLFSWSGNPDTSIDVFRWEGEDGWLNQHIFKVTAGEGLSDPFLFFLLKWLRPRFAEIARNKQTTGLGHVTIQDLKRMRVAVPNEKEQSKIVQIIGPLQEKIDLIRQMNETLEAMARAIFKDWFVDFGPTRAKMAMRGEDPQKHNVARAPYLAPDIWVLFPDRLDDEGKPEGWRLGTLGDVAQQVGESVKPEALDPGTPYIGLEHMPRKSIALSDWDGADKVSSGKLAFRKGDFLFGKLRPYFHKVGIAPVDGICSTDIVVLNSRKREAAAFVLACISQDEFVAFTDRTSDGTKMPRTSWGRMERYSLCIPNQAVLKSFNECIEPMLERIVANIHESRTLAATRDLLLPKLMSGEIRVRDAEKLVGEAT
ncbi:restriction endonuclease subunit S [Sphingopyxis sp. LK2115]|uniref:restriction endonuclease subunit S n=1 Tax=Sphingopyxis sp. LK2115 TaxID=2744558 RepID=UPI001660238E|nr:restriction endonuclease subunit S [Sphingopyxis sp. LK2115]